MAARWERPDSPAPQRPIYAGVAADAKPLPAGSRISFRNVSCGFDGTVTTCVNNFDQSGFVLSPAGSFILNPTTRCCDRPEGTNPLLQLTAPVTSVIGGCRQPTDADC